MRRLPAAFIVGTVRTVPSMHRCRAAGRRIAPLDTGTPPDQAAAARPGTADAVDGTVSDRDDVRIKYMW
jgi:hypothetical protein